MFNRKLFTVIFKLLLNQETVKPNQSVEYNFVHKWVIHVAYAVQSQMLVQ
jgi:hypothetical protein